MGGGGGGGGGGGSERQRDTQREFRHILSCVSSLIHPTPLRVRRSVLAHCDCGWQQSYGSLFSSPRISVSASLQLALRVSLPKLRWWVWVFCRLNSVPMYAPPVWNPAECTLVSAETDWLIPWYLKTSEREKERESDPGARPATRTLPGTTKTRKTSPLPSYRQWLRHWKGNRQLHQIRRLTEQLENTFFITTAVDCNHPDNATVHA